MIPDNHLAFSRYHTVYNNDQYQTLAHQLASDLKSNRESAQVSDMMNTVLCGI